MEIVFGLMLVTLAGLGTGTSAWPMKIIKDFHFEQYLFVFMLTGLIIYPWLIVLLNVPDFTDVIRTVGWKPLIISNLMSACWGIANILYLIGVVRIGAALTGAILSAVGLAIGVMIPMIFKGSGLFSNAPGIFSGAGMVIVSGLLVIIAGVILVSIAGFGREKILRKNDQSGRNKSTRTFFIKNLLLIILAGFLSSGISFAFVYSQGPIIEAVKQQGAGEIIANFSVWALGMPGGGLISVLYASYLMTKNKTWKQLLLGKAEIFYGSIIGMQFILSIVLMGRGMVLLGSLGASIGFAIQQSMQITGNQLVGFISGEWKAVNGKPRKLMYTAIGIILIAILILAYGNTV